MIGNDVVDLGDPEAQPSALHPRFDDRVFSEDEQGLIATADSAHEMRWMIWAGKESAYKLVKRQNSSAVFSPFVFQARIDSQDLLKVIFQGRSMCVGITRFGTAIHAVAGLTLDQVERSTSDIQTTRSNPSTAVRFFARRRLAQIHSLPMEAIEIATGPHRIPEIMLCGKRSSQMISLSHHGRYVAFALQDSEFP